MRMFVAVTDNDWFKFLKNIKPDEVNFWQPGRRRNFRALKEGELFLFKLHSPYNYVVGGGIFVRQAFFPLSLTWDIFGIKNGRASREEFMEAIYSYRRTDMLSEPDPIIGSLVLAEPFFFQKQDWIPVPRSWSPHIVQGKTYNTGSPDGKMLYEAVQHRLVESAIAAEHQALYGKPQLIKPRLGQGGFRITVTQAYDNRCAMTGERTLPVLNAAHIKPYSKNGPHATSNGLLLRQDVHTLFDRGYITVTTDSVVEVSKRIKEDYGNGRDYYKLHGHPLLKLPERADERPSAQFLQWHNENVYVGQ
ncbi:MAG TPA: HNH endonuclease [bacterium]|nr:HNH endonuclease [bacterium]